MSSFCTPLAQQQVGAKALGQMPRDAAKRDLAIVFKDWRSARAHSVGGELFKQSDGRENASSANKPNTLVKSTIYAYIYILHTYRLQGKQTRSGTETETETVWNVSVGKVCQVELFWQSLSKSWALALWGERKAINKLPEKIILICPRSAERSREEGRESVCVGETASCCWSSRSPFDVMQSALTKCQCQAKEPKPKASPDLTACLPCAFKISLAAGLGLLVCAFHASFFIFVLRISFWLFLWAFWKVAVVRLIGNVHLWHFVGTKQRPELFRIQTLCLISRYTYHLSFSFPTLNVFPQFPHKIAKCSLCPASIPQSLSLSPLTHSLFPYVRLTVS